MIYPICQNSSYSDVSSQGKFANVQLQSFTDASERAYAALIYATITDVDGHIVSKLVASKTRVATIKTVSLPRLELCAAHLGIKLLVKVALPNLPSPTNYGWTDSTIVLQWFSQLPWTWSCFVANRESKIQQTLPRENLNHIRSSLNPADCASRGMTVQDLWWLGPTWLLHPETLGLNYLQRSMMKCEKWFKQNKSRNPTLIQSLPLKSWKLYLTLHGITLLTKPFV